MNCCRPHFIFTTPPPRHATTSLIPLQHLPPHPTTARRYPIWPLTLQHLSRAAANAPRSHRIRPSRILLGLPHHEEDARRLCGHVRNATRALRTRAIRRSARPPRSKGKAHATCDDIRAGLIAHSPSRKAPKTLTTSPNGPTSTLWETCRSGMPQDACL